jgi:predicted transcriptional regulator
MPKLTKEKTCTVGVRVSEELKEELLKMAKEQNRNLSNTVETILKDYVKQKKTQNEDEKSSG